MTPRGGGGTGREAAQDLGRPADRPSALQNAPRAPRGHADGVTFAPLLLPRHSAVGAPRNSPTEGPGPTPPAGRGIRWGAAPALGRKPGAGGLQGLRSASPHALLVPAPCCTSRLAPIKPCPTRPAPGGYAAGAAHSGTREGGSVGGGKLFISVTKTRRSHGQRGRETGDPWGQLRGTPTATRAGGAARPGPPSYSYSGTGGHGSAPARHAGSPGRRWVKILINSGWGGGGGGTGCLVPSVPPPPCPHGSTLVFRGGRSP